MHLRRLDWKRVRRGGALAAVAVILIVGGMAAGWRLAGEDHADTELGRVGFEIEPALGGGVEGYVPVADWGLRADALDAPFRLHAELRSLNRRALLRAADGDRSVLRAAERDVRDGARAAVIRAFAWGAALALALLGIATLIWRRMRPRWALAAAGVPLLAISTAITLWAAQESFDVARFEQPTYFARGRELGRILEVAEDERVRSDYGSEFASILRSMSAVLTDGGLAEPPGRTLYVASDLHANALVIDPLARLIRDEPVLLVGDVAQRGSAAESALLAPRVAALGSQVVAVSGNHDSRAMMHRLRAEGVSVIGSEGRLGASGYEGSPILDVDGIRVAAFSDPLEYVGDEPDSRDRPITFEELPDGKQALERAEEALIAWYKQLPRRPDVVMVHQNRLAQALGAWLLANEGEGGGGSPTIVTGDDHVQHVDRFGDSVVVDGGSVGAGGIFEAGREPIGFAQLHFAPDAARLRSIDLIAVEPFSGAARASRIVLDGLCPETRRCSVEPEPVDPRELAR